MPFEVRLTTRAETDIDAAIEYLMAYSPRTAARWHAELTAKIATLEENPDRYALAEEAPRLGIALREMLFGKKPHVYRILYVIQALNVNVLHVRHAARDWITPD